MCRTQTLKDWQETSNVESYACIGSTIEKQWFHWLDILNRHHSVFSCKSILFFAAMLFYVYFSCHVHFLSLAVCHNSSDNSASRRLHSFSPFSFLTYFLQQLNSLPLFSPFLISQSVFLRRWTQPPGHIFVFGDFLVSPAMQICVVTPGCFCCPLK